MFTNGDYASDSQKFGDCYWLHGVWAAEHWLQELLVFKLQTVAVIVWRFMEVSINQIKWSQHSLSVFADHCLL